MASIFNTVWATLGLLGITLLGATGLAYWLFQRFSEKWLVQRFDKQLEDHKHAQQRELEQLKVRINAAIDRTTKLHQFEFEALPKLWAAATAAFGEVWRFVSPFQTHPDLDRMNPLELDHFLTNSKLADYQKDQLRTGPDKATRHAKMFLWHEAKRVNEVYFSFHNYLVANGIFLPKDLQTKFMALRDLIHEALFERTYEEEHQNFREDRFKKGRALRDGGNAMIEDIEKDVHTRLRFDPLEGAKA